MIGCFVKSRLIMALGGVATLAVAFVIAVRRMEQGQPLWLTLITLILLLLLGVVLSRLLANFAAAREHQKLLGVLYIELDPDRFLSRYADVAKRVKPTTADSVMVISYLADGMCAAGRYDEAIAALNRCTVPRGKSALALECLLCDSKSHCLLQKGDVDAATAELQRYDTLLQRAKQAHAKLAENLARKFAVFGQELAFLQGGQVDLDAVQAAIAQSSVHIRRLELTLLKAGVLARDGKLPQAQECCKTVLEEGSRLALAKQAQSLRTQMQHGNEATAVCHNSKICYR